MDVNLWTGLTLSLITTWLLVLELFKPRNPSATILLPVKMIVTDSGAASPVPPSSPSPATAIETPVVAPSPDTQYALKIEDATWCVAGMDPMKRQPHCASGFAIDPTLIDRNSSEGVFVVTNYHVIANTGPEPMVSYQGRAKEDGNWQYGEVLKTDMERDLALVLIQDAQSPVVKLAERAPEQEGLWVKAVGFPNDQPLTIKESEFIGMQSNCLAVVPCIGMAQNTITHGNSGGPLGAKESDLMGSGSDGQEVVIGVNEGETTVEQAISIDVVKDFLSSSDSQPQFQANPFREEMPMPSMQGPPRREPRFYVQ